MNKIQNKKTEERGFTLIEILVVIGIIAVLAAIVLIAINPAEQFAKARDTERRSNITAILDGVGQYIADNQGDVPTSITTTKAEIGSDLCLDLVPDYLPALPTDPESDSGDVPESGCSGLGTGDVLYDIQQDSSSNRITVFADEAEAYDPDDNGIPDPITITR